MLTMVIAGVIAGAGALGDAKAVAVMARAEGNLDSLLLGQVEAAAVTAVRESVADRLVLMEDPPNAEAEKARKAAAQLVTEARAAGDALDTEKALQLANDALVQLQSAAVTAKDVRALAEGHLLCFRASTWNDRQQDAQEHVRAALALVPDIKLEAAASADENAAFKRVAGEVARQSKGVLTVASNPPGARVLVDGVDRGIAPVTVREMTPGRHVVRFAMPWRSPVLLSAMVPAGGEGRAQASLQELDMMTRARAALQADTLDGNAGDWRHELAAASVDHAVILVAEQPANDAAHLAVTVHVFRIADAKRRRRTQALVDAIKVDKEVRALVVDALAVDKGAGMAGGARFVAPEEQRAAVAAAAAEDGGGGGGGGPPAFLPALLVIPLVPVALLVGAGAGFVAGAVVSGFYFQQQLQAQAAANRRSSRRDTAAQTTVLGY